jgi:hypothetical protein
MANGQSMDVDGEENAKGYQPSKVEKERVVDILRSAVDSDVQDFFRITMSLSFTMSDKILMETRKVKIGPRVNPGASQTQIRFTTVNQLSGNLNSKKNL